MRHAAGLLLVILLAAGCGKDSSGSSSSSGSSGSSAKRISGGTETRFGGVVFDVPQGWRSEARGGGLVLSPPEANAQEELYLVLNDPAGRTIDGAEAEQSVETGVRQLNPSATRKSGPSSRKFGDVDGRIWTYSAPTPDGRQAEIRVYAYLASGTSCLLALGFPDSLSKREKDIDALLASISKPAAPPAGAGGVAQEICGKWIWFSSLTANNGGGSQTNTWIILEASGRYKWHYDSVSTNPNGGAWGSEDETGTWSADGGTISFRPDRGNPYTQTLVKRNHPKNVGDPMIVLGGKAYVTATNRQPW